MRSTMTAVERLAHGGGSERTRARVALVSDDVELRELLTSTELTLVRRDALSDLELDHLDVVVIDRRAGVPEAMVASLAGHIPILAVLDGRSRDRGTATDVVERPLDAHVLHRRVSVLAELRQLRRATVVLESALAHSVTGLAIADPRQPDCPIVYVSPVFETLTGYAADEVVGRNCRFLRGPDADPEQTQRLREAVAARSTERTVLRNRRKDGTPFWNELTIFPIPGERGQVLYLGGMQHDVTELMETRAEIARALDDVAAQHAFTLAALDALQVAVVCCDAERRVAYANRAAGTLLGEAPSLLVGRGVGEAISDAVIGFWNDGAATAELRFQRVRADGRTREISASAQRCSVVAADAIDVILVLHDRTETQQAERLARLATVSVMAAGFAHEVRNPLANVRMFVELLAAELTDDDDRRQLLDRLMGQVTRIERLVRTSLQFARPERPRLAAHWPSVIVNTTLEALATRTRRSGAVIRVDMTDGLPKVTCDDGQLVQVLVALINNGLDAAGDPGEVTLRVRREEQQVVFSIIDEGPGIPAHLLTEIFNPFFTTKAGGTGLGLSIAQQVVHENGGQLGVANGDQRGAIFTVSMKVATP
ncbi:MAG: PAS domain S-box protein [Burkholderiales bacterium]|nr:PAS domain S-box protein [Burkholderiales bacterium]